MRPLPVIVTKCGDDAWHNGGHSPFSREVVLASFNRSKDLLGKIDILLLHDPNQTELNEFFTEGREGFEAFKELKSKKEVIGTGIGVREHDVLTRFMQYPSDVADVILAVNDYNLLRRSINCCP